MMQLGAETVFVGSGIFMKDGATPLDVSSWTEIDAQVGRCSKDAIGNPKNPEDHEEAVSRAKAIVLAATHFNDPHIVAEASEAITGTMKGLAAAAIEESQRMQTRGW